MKIAALSTAAGLSVATLKYYLREGLLHPGQATAVNQAEYDDSHLRRLRLLRALTELGGLGLADVRRVLEAVDDPARPLHETFGVAQDALARRPGHPDPAALAAADTFIQRHGLRIRPEAAVRGLLANALAAMRDFGLCIGPTFNAEAAAAVLDPFVAAALAEARGALESVPSGGHRAEQVLVSVAGTVALESAQLALRRIALEHASAERFGGDPGGQQVEQASMAMMEGSVG